MTNASTRLFNFTLDMLPFIQRRELLDIKDLAPTNHAKLIDDLMEIHGHEILVDGYFNGGAIVRAFHMCH